MDEEDIKRRNSRSPESVVCVDPIMDEEDIKRRNSASSEDGSESDSSEDGSESDSSASVQDQDDEEEPREIFRNEEDPPDDDKETSTNSEDREPSVRFGDDDTEKLPDDEESGTARPASSPEKPRVIINWDDLTPEQQMVKDKYMNDRRRRIRALSEQKFHLPGQNWKEDWVQYFANNHPIFGICLHYPEHSVGWGMRCLCFLSSIVFGLSMTNMFWLWSRTSDNNEPIFTVEVGTRPGSNYTGYVVDVDEDNQVQVTKDIILLWTVGGMLHGAFDNLIWTLSICACCDAGARFEHLAKYKKIGVGLLAFFVLIIMALCTLTVVVRGVIEAGDESGEESTEVSEMQSAGVFDDSLDLSQSGKENYEFMMSFSVELALALLVYFPLLGTIFFTGILGCFRVQQLGGRPYEIMEEREELEELMQNPEEALTRDSTSEWEDEPSENDGPKKPFTRSTDDPRDSKRDLGDGPSIWNCWDCCKRKERENKETDLLPTTKPSMRSTDADDPRDSKRDLGDGPSIRNCWDCCKRKEREKKESDLLPTTFNQRRGPPSQDYPSVNPTSKRYDPSTGSELAVDCGALQESSKWLKRRREILKCSPWLETFTCLWPIGSRHKRCLIVCWLKK